MGQPSLDAAVARIAAIGEYREAFVVGGRSDRDVGQVCQLRDGSWWKIEG